jgi:hypothetical protein
MIGSKKKPFQLTPESMQALAELPRLGLGAAPQSMAPQGMANAGPLIDMPAPSAAAAPMSMQPDLAGLKQNVAPIKGSGLMNGIKSALAGSDGKGSDIMRFIGGLGNNQGGFGALMAGRDADRAAAAAQAQLGVQNTMLDRRVANDEAGTRQTGLYQDGMLAGQRNGQLITQQGNFMAADTARRAQDISERGNIRSNNTSLTTAELAAATSRLNNGDTVAATYAGQDAGERNSVRTTGASMLSRAPQRQVTSTIPAKSGEFNFFSPNGPGTPKQQITESLPVISGPGELYDSLPVGMDYVDGDGVVRTKPPEKKRR